MQGAGARGWGQGAGGMWSRGHRAGGHRQVQGLMHVCACMCMFNCIFIRISACVSGSVYMFQTATLPGYTAQPALDSSLLVRPSYVVGAGPTHAPGDLRPSTLSRVGVSLCPTLVPYLLPCVSLCARVSHPCPSLVAQLIKAAEQRIQHLHNQLRAPLGAQLREAHDVAEQHGHLVTHTTHPSETVSDN